MNRKHSYKDLEKFKKTRNAQKQRYRDRNGAFMYEKRSYDDWEDRLILAHEMRDVELSVKLQRSVSAIQQRRGRLKKLEANN